MKKICSVCKEEKTIDNFTKKRSTKDGHNAACRSCTVKRTRKHYSENRQYYIKKKTERQNGIRDYIYAQKEKGKCSMCPESDAICLDFHHTSEDKSINIACIGNAGWSLERVKKELAKCILVCANCHRKIHRDVKVNRNNF